MNVVHAVRLNAWVVANKTSLSTARKGTIADCARDAERALGFKVAASALTEIMRANGLQTKRVSQSQAEKLQLLAANEKLLAENQQLKRTLAKLKVSENIPDEYKAYVFEDLSDEVRDSIFSGR